MGIGSHCHWNGESKAHLFKSKPVGGRGRIDEWARKWDMMVGGRTESVNAKHGRGHTTTASLHVTTNDHASKTTGRKLSGALENPFPP